MDHRGDPVILLAIETATELVGAAVADERGVRATTWVAGRRRHTEALAPAIEHVCAQSDVEIADLDVVAVDVGPGLFTGLRVGVATAKGLAQGLGVGVIPATSLDVLAAAALEAGTVTPVVAVVDARRAEVFSARYAPTGADRGPVMVDPPRLWRPEDLADQLAAGPEGLLAVGDGARRYAELLERAPGLRVGGPTLGAPTPEALARLALARLAAGQRPVGATGTEPVYLRDADARINWVSRQEVPR